MPTRWRIRRTPAERRSQRPVRLTSSSSSREAALGGQSRRSLPPCEIFGIRRAKFGQTRIRRHIPETCAARRDREPLHLLFQKSSGGWLRDVREGAQRDLPARSGQASQARPTGSVVKLRERLCTSAAYVFADYVVSCMFLFVARFSTVRAQRAVIIRAKTYRSVACTIFAANIANKRTGRYW